MKLALVFDHFLYGGIERVGISYIKLLVSSGHSVDVYIMNEDYEDIIHELDGLCGVKIMPLSISLCPEASWHHAMESGELGLGTFKFAARYLVSTLRTRIAAKRCRKDGQHYDVAIAFSGHLRDLTFVSENYISSDYKLGWLHGSQYQYALLSPGFYRLYAKIKNLVCLTENNDVECLPFNTKHGIRKRKISNPCTAPSKETVKKEKVAELKKQYGDFCLMVGRLAEDKDQETVIRAIQVLRDKYGMKKNLVLVGSGNQRQALEKLVHQLDLDDQVFFEGARYDVQNYYSAATVYTHGSPMESFGLVYLEAMALGLPVVSTEAIAGGREILGNNEYGLLSPNWDEEALAKNIKKIYDDKNLRENLIQKGYQRVEDFSPKKIIAQLNSFLEEITQKHP